jgi:hypothetical protein
LSVELSDSVGLDRGNLAAQTRSVLNRGGWGNPDVLLVESEVGSVVVKDFAPRARYVRNWLGPWLLRREAKAYRRLEGVDAVPHLLGQLDAAALVLEYRPGILLSRSLAGQLPPAFLAELQGAVAEMHRRGVVHLDLRHRSNILAGQDGRPVVLDFASALCFDPATWWGRALVHVLGWVDRRALRKWRVRLLV